VPVDVRRIEGRLPLETILSAQEKADLTAYLRTL
jgi:hypothetical protein